MACFTGIRAGNLNFVLYFLEVCACLFNSYTCILKSSAQIEEPILLVTFVFKNNVRMHIAMYVCV